MGWVAVWRSSNHLFMKTHLLSHLWKFVMIALGFFVGGLYAADGEVSKYGPLVGTVAVPEGLSSSQVKDVIITSLIAREWTVKEKTSDYVIGYLNHRGNEATLTLVYDSKQILMYCDGWLVEKSTGRRIKPELPKGWIANLKKDLPKRLALPVVVK